MKHIFSKSSVRFSVLIVFFTYFIISIIYWMPPLFSFNNYIIGIGGGKGDPGAFIWFLSWWPYAILHGLNPFLEKYAWAPYGQNLAWVNSIPALAIFMGPVTYYFGPVVSYNIIALLSPPLAALSMFIFTYYFTKRLFPSFFAGYFFGFSSYMIGELRGAPNLYVIFLIPVLFLICIMFMKKQIKKTYFIFFMCITLIIQFCISPEIFTTVTFFGFISWVVGIIVFRKDYKNFLCLFKYLAVSYFLSFIILSPYFYYMYIGFSQFSAPSSLLLYYNRYNVANVLEYIIPTPITYLGGNAFIPLTNSFIGNWNEMGAYLGLPLIAILIIYIIRNWGAKHVKFLSIMLLVVFFASLGTPIRVGDISIGPGPGILILLIPLLHIATPVRFSMYISFIASIIIALFLGKYNKSILAYISVLIAIIFIIPNVPGRYNNFMDSKISMPKIFSTKEYKKLIYPNENILIIPFGVNGSSMFYQAVDKFYYRTPDGYLGQSPQYILKLPILNTLYNNKIIPHLRSNLLYYIKYSKINAILIIGKREQLAWEKIFQLSHICIAKHKISRNVAIFLIHNKIILSHSFNCYYNYNNVLVPNSWK